MAFIGIDAFASNVHVAYLGVPIVGLATLLIVEKLILRATQVEPDSRVQPES
jgi:hypothetical protein